jgi:hypothetical protein
MRAVVTLAVLIGTVGMASAQSTGPVIAIPGRPGVPVIINGVDASYAVVEGDWGLGKGVHYQPVVYGGHPVEPGPPVGHYYPSSGHLPGYGRLEIESAAKPKPAPTFRQTWSAGSRDADPLIPPASFNPVPPFPPPVIVAPQFNDHRREHKRGQQNSAIPQPNSAPPPQDAAPAHESSPAPQQSAPAPQPEVRAPEGPPHHQ